MNGVIQTLHVIPALLMGSFTVASYSNHNLFPGIYLKWETEMEVPSILSLASTGLTGSTALGSVRFLYLA